MDRDEAVDRVYGRWETKPPAWMAGALAEVTVALWCSALKISDAEVGRLRAAIGRGETTFLLDNEPQDELADILDGTYVGKYYTCIQGANADAFGKTARAKIGKESVSERNGHGAPDVRYYPLEDGSVLCTTERFESPDLRTHVAAELASGMSVPECWMWPGFDWRKQPEQVAG